MLVGTERLHLHRFDEGSQLRACPLKVENDELDTSTFQRRPSLGRAHPFVS